MFDFSLTEKRYIENAGEVSVYTHKSGGSVICIDNSDENCVFSLCFNTPACDDTGIPHILEHCVLCGSRRFPFKDPFNMLVGSISHTYLNAITFPHKTLFPTASCDKASLSLAARVYCDAVFDPLVYTDKGIFLQEGGFYDGQKIRGVVYGEMSGLYDDPKKACEMWLIKAFTPFHSAGTPEEIPNVSYEAMLEYHKKHYTAENCLAYVYGNCDKKEYLQLLDEYFSKHGGSRIKSDIPMPKRKTSNFGIPSKQKAAVFPLCKTSDPVKTAAYEIIVSVLKKTLSADMEFNSDGAIAYAFMPEADRSTVEKAVKNAVFTQKDIDRLHFYIAKEDFGYKPKGLFLAMKLMYADGSLDSIDFNAIFKKLEKADLKRLAEEAFADNGIYAKFKPDTKEYVYAVTDTAPLEKYENMCERPMPAPLSPVLSFTGSTEDNGIVFTPSENKNIIYLTLAFELDAPFEILSRSGVLLREFHTGLEEMKIEAADLGKPCLVLHSGFFADNTSAANEINSVFRAAANFGAKHIIRSEQYTDLLALSDIEKTAYVLNIAAGFESRFDDADPKEICKSVFRRQNMHIAVCCHPTLFEKAKKIISSLCPNDGVFHENLPFKPNFGRKIIQTQNSVNTISMALTPKCSRAAAVTAAEILKNTYLWEEVRNKGAYGIDCRFTPSGSLCINSFKDINFEKTIEAFGHCEDFLNQIKEDDMPRYKLMCLNAVCRPKSAANKNLHALRVRFGCADIYEDILGLKSEDLHDIFPKEKNIACFKSK